MDSEKPNWKKTVFRLSKIPNHVADHCKVRALIAKATNISIDAINVYSLATTLSPWEMPKTKVATIMFLEVPLLLEQSSDAQKVWLLGADDGLVLDCHFWGLTPLNDVQPETHIADCIAISGLSSHAFGSWQPRGNDKTFMWIRDEAPALVPGMRAILYGYDTGLVQSCSFQSIGHLALGLISQIRSNGGALDDAKPLVFLAHSLGGIVLKDALCRLANSQDNSLERKILMRCKGAIMFGVPNLGMDQGHLLTIVRGDSAEHLVQDLSRESGAYGYLDRLERSFSGIAELGEMSFSWVFETDKSPTFEVQTGKMTGRPAILVDPDSATAHRVKEHGSPVHPIARNHSELVKFTRADPNLGPIIELLRQICGLSGDDVVDSIAEARDTALSPSSQYRERQKTLSEKQLDEHRLQLLGELFISLNSPDLDLRQALIVDRFGHTCEWIYNYEPFTSWLKKDQGIFWVNGKPGSGKSTLMKLIFTDPRTWQYSHDFEDSVSQISAGFFFNYRGTSIQKTLEGLMRSVLRQIVKGIAGHSACHRLVEYLFETPTFRFQGGNSWPIGRLEEALRAILGQNLVQLRITFFFDALDEFDGPPDYICRFLKYITKKPPGSLTTAKVCFSSRPWEDFITNFGDGLHLTVEDFTKPDIRYFCTTNLTRSVNATHHGLIPHLVDEVVLRASGVFLWASLILKELIAAFENHKFSSLQDLMDLLRSVPTELTEYYHFILQRIPESLRWYTYALLEATVRARSPREFGLRYLWRTTHISDSRTYAEALQVLTQLKARGSAKEVQRSVLLWGGGLIHLSPLDAHSSLPTVQLMHQTVYDFVVKLDFKDQVLGPLGKETYQNGHIFHLKSLFSFRFEEDQMRLNTGATRNDLLSSLDHGAEAEETTGRSFIAFLDSVPEIKIRDLGVGLMACLHPQMGYLMDLFASVRISTHVACATYLRLRLYLRDCILETPDFFRAHPKPFGKLLTITALCLASRETHAHQRLLIANFLLDHGYSVSTEPDLFTYIIQPVELEVGMAERAWHKECLDGLDRLGALMLQHGQPHSQRISYSKLTGRKWCKAIHIALPATTASILDHGVDVNELDSRGRTPLDWVLLDRMKSCPERNPLAVIMLKEDVRVLYQVASILVTRGGLRNDSTLHDWRLALQKFNKQGFDISELPRDISSVRRKKDTQRGTSQAPLLASETNVTKVSGDDVSILASATTSKHKSSPYRAKEKSWSLKHLLSKWHRR